MSKAVKSTPPSLVDLKNFELPQDEVGTVQPFDNQAASHYHVELSPEQMELTTQWSDARVRLSRLAGIPDRQWSGGNADWRGYIGEFAVAELLGIDYPPFPTMAINPVDLWLWDGASIDVKSIQAESEQLGVYIDIYQPCEIYILTIVQEASPYVIIKGWTTQKQLFLPGRVDRRPLRSRDEYLMMQYELFDMKYLMEGYYDEKTTD